ncbi:hypothetical protein [Reyranella sp.]|uniref:hypothetical protein n=1 Tax=Reyranella sp. TaxID=1929291 RepID=UPI003BAC0C54
MDSLDTLLLMRMAERLLGLLAGALSIVLGYGLFIRLPEKTDSSGKVVLPGGISIWMSRVGPGLFFALFGAAIIAYSFTSTVKVTDEQLLAPPAGKPTAEAATIRRQEVGAMSDRSSPTPSAEEREQSLVRLRGAMADLNAAIERLDRDDREQRLVAGLQNAKLLLLRSSWQPRWGDPARFQSWINSGARPPAPAGLDEPAGLYLAGPAR